MTLRRIFFLMGLITLVASLSAGCIYLRSLYRSSYEANLANAIADSQAIHTQLRDHISNNYNAIEVLAGLDAVQTGLRNTALIQDANKVLDTFKDGFDLSVCYLLDRSGTTVASSNRDSFDSFVGKNYSFRPYFKNALAGNASMYMAIGVTSGKRGIYYSAPVTDGRDGRILGVVAMKTSVEQLEKLIRNAALKVSGIGLLCSPDGIVFLSSRESWLNHTLQPLSPSVIKTIRRNQQLGEGPWPWTGLTLTGTASAKDNDDRTYHVYQKHFVDTPGWHFLHLASTDQLKNQVMSRDLRNSAVVTFFITALLAIGVLLLFFKTDIEITKRYRVQKKLIESESRYRELFDHMMNGVVIYESGSRGDEFIIKDLNEASETILARSHDQIIGQEVSTVFPGVRKGELMEVFNRVHQSGIPERYPVSFYQDGKLERWVENFVFTLPTGELASSFVDLTDYKKMEETLRQSEQRFKSVIEEIADAIVVVDNQGIIRFANDVAASFFNKSREKLLGTSFELPLTENDQSEVKLEGPDGKGVVVEMRLVKGEWDGKGVYYASLRDITARKKAEDERAELEERLRLIQKMEAIGTLAGGIAHDFNNILSSVLGFTELAMDEAKPGSTLESNLTEVLDAGNRAKSLVSQIVMFSRQSEHENQPIQLQPLIKETVKLLRSSLPPTIEIKHELSSEAVIMADPVTMHQLLLNLCTNASHAMAGAGGQLTIATRDLIIEENSSSFHPKLSVGSYLELSVSDTGSGIDEAILDRIFDPFFTTKGTGEGTGMGLSVVHGIVEAHKGIISVDTEKGKGTSFHIYLPVAETETETQRGTDSRISSSSESILFVDDEESIAKMIKQTLKKNGFSVMPLTNSHEALAVFEADPTRFDLVITDMTMPGLNGLELAGKIKQIKSDMPIILCTGYSPEMKEIKEASGILDAVVIKPLVKKQLLETIREVTARFQPNGTRQHAIQNEQPDKPV